MSDVRVRLLPRDSSYVPLTNGIQVARVIQDTGRTRLAGGFARFDADGQFGSQAIPYDEVIFVHQGQVEVEHEGGRLIVRSGDAALIAKGAAFKVHGIAGTIGFYVERLD